MNFPRRRVVNDLARACMQVDCVAGLQLSRILHFHARSRRGVQHRDLLAQHLVDTEVEQRIAQPDQRPRVFHATDKIRFQLSQRGLVLVVARIHHSQRGQLDIIGLQLAGPTARLDVAANRHRCFGTAYTKTGIGDRRGTQLDLAVAIIHQHDLAIVAACIHCSVITLQVELAFKGLVGWHCDQDGAGYIDGTGLHAYAVAGIDRTRDADRAISTDLFRSQGACHQAVQGPTTGQDVSHDTRPWRGHGQRADVQHTRIAYHHALRVDEEHAPANLVGAFQNAVQGAIDVDLRIPDQVDQVVHLLGRINTWQHQVHHVVLGDIEILERVEGDPVLYRRRCHRDGIAGTAYRRGGFLGSVIMYGDDGICRHGRAARHRQPQHRADRHRQACRTQATFRCQRGLQGRCGLGRYVNTIHGSSRVHRCQAAALR